MPATKMIDVNGWFPRVGGTVVACVIVGVLATANVAGAATFSVSDQTDAALQSPTGTSCVSTDGGQCTLRAAIQAADNLGGASSISLAAGTFKLTIAAVASGSHDDDPATGDLDIDQLNGAGSLPAITIAGAGTEATTIDGNGVDRVFAVHTPVTTPSSLSISGMTIKGGSQPGSGPSANSTSPGYGGAIYDAGTLAIDDSILTANSSGQQGGAIYYGGLGPLTITNSTLQGNTTSVAGGGLASASTAAAVTLVNDTFDGNHGGSSGGAIAYLGHPAPGSEMEHVTIAHNSAASAGGIYGPSYALTIENTIVASNPGTAVANCYDPNGVGTADQAGAADVGGNVDSDSTCFSPATTGDLTSVDPKLAPLGDNGGPTPTDALLAGSPAIFHGLASACAPADQRDVTRLSSFCDPGAYQTLDADLALTGSGPTSAQSSHPFADTFTVTNGGPYAAAGVTFTDPVPPGTTATAVASQGSCTVTAAVQCSLGALTSAASATVTVTLTPAQPGTVSNPASVSTSALDPASANDSATVTTSVTGHPPVNTALPTITGIVAINAPLTAGNGSWSNTPTSFAYQWQVCHADGEGCFDVLGETTSTYTPSIQDVHQTIRVQVTASNEDGSATATSAPTEPIVKAAFHVTVGTAHTDGTTVVLPAECLSGNLGFVGFCQLLFLLTAQSANAGNTQRAASSAAHHAKPVIVGKLKAKLHVGKRKTVHITLNRTGRRLLAKHHTLKVKLTVSQNGKKVRTKTITFKTKAKKKHH
jgi:hypothetical protein